MRKRKREKVIKSKRWGSERTREEQRREGGTLAPRGVQLAGVTLIKSDQINSAGNFYALQRCTTHKWVLIIITTVKNYHFDNCQVCCVMQAAAREEILANGGSISHHHGGRKYFLVFFVMSLVMLCLAFISSVEVLKAAALPWGIFLPVVVSACYLGLASVSNQVPQPWLGLIIFGPVSKFPPWSCLQARVSYI